jgi:feruloyl esterase
MMRRTLSGLFLALTIAVGFHPVPAAAPGAAGCASLTAMTLPDTTIKSSTEVSGPTFTPSGGEDNRPLNGLPPFCRIVGVTKPAINFEVWLPLNNWNGKYQGVGNGANAGSISYPAMAAALKLGYATSSTDTGHSTTNARDARWAVGHPELVIDFAYRAIHVTAESAKKSVQAFYGQPASHAYFNSCSTGGRQALMEAQRFPQDYDGIIAGDPAANWTRFQTGGHLWLTSALNKDPESYIPTPKLKIVDDAVMAACDAIDGVKDGVLDDPRKCKLDPATLVCKAGQDPNSCLTAKQALAVKNIWSGVRNSAGRLIYPPYMPGNESAGGWASYMTGEGPRSGSHWVQSDNVLKYMVFENPNWDFRTFDWDKDFEFALAKLGKNMDAFDPNLTPFQQRGGKLLMYHGWSDPSISPLNSIDYYENVVTAMQGKQTHAQAVAKTEEFMRLFMVPGMLHCSGGPGPNSFDALSALDHWVDKKQAPDQMVASHSTRGAVDRTRPLCVYPRVAVYKGTGSTDAAENFTCQLPK